MIDSFNAKHTRKMKNIPKMLSLCLILLPSIAAQRFLRSSDAMESDFRGEMKLDENEGLSGMTREMFLMQDINWELQPPILSAALESKMRSHIRKYLSKPVQLKLLKKQGKYGLRAVGVTGNGQKLRAFWRQGVAGKDRAKASDFLEVSYDTAVRSRLFTVEFEVQLPPLPGSKELPSVVFQIPVEPGNMNPKAMVARGAGTVRVYPAGRSEEPLDDVGICRAGAAMRAGLVDRGWAKGLTVFRKGRSVGIV
jgi:hypothetical protein